MELRIDPAEIFDVVIVGGGPAGQSAALLLGRGLRRVTVEDVERSRFGFRVHCGDGTTLTTRALLLASDVVAPTPAITGAEQFYGRSLHQCPHCNGWEHRGRTIGALGADEAAVDLALKLLQWSPRVTLFANGEMVDTTYLKRLEKGRIQVVPGIVSALEGQDGKLERMRIGKTSSHPCEALFFAAPRKYHSSLAARLGCDLERMSGAVYWRPDGDGVIQGLFVAASDLNPREITTIAASEGLKADPYFRRLSWPSRALLIDCAQSSLNNFNTLKTTDTGMKGAQETR